MVHKGKNYSSELLKYHFYTTTKFVILFDAILRNKGLFEFYFQKLTFYIY